MSRLVINLLLIVFLFGTVEAAIDTVSIDISHEQSSDHLNHDHDKSSSNNVEDDCDHHCHCAGQLGFSFTYCIHSYQTTVIDMASDTYLYRSQLSPPLFRPPII